MSIQPNHQNDMFVTFSLLCHYGRLGNQLFQIAATIGAARRNNVSFLFPPWNYSLWMAVPLPQISDPISFECVYEEPEFSYVPIHIQMTTDIRGYFQSEKYFANCREEIRHYFTPGHRLTEEIDRLQDAYFYGIPQEKTCSVSIRRGDYVNNGYYFDLPGSDYYLNALEHFGNEYFFIVFSDGIDWCRDFFSRSEFHKFTFFFVTPTLNIADLFFMSRCRNHILANSTFCWWGAWLNPSPEKRVIAPQEWFGEVLTKRDRPYRQGGYHNTSDLIPDTWQTIHAIPRQHADGET